MVVSSQVEYKTNKDVTSTHTLSLIVKAELTQGAMKELFKDSKAFEHSFYYNLVPKAKKWSDMSFIPRSLFSPRPTVTVLEDLKEQGFMMKDRSEMLDFNHSRLYASAAASLHAVSFMVFKENPEMVEPIRHVRMFSNDKPEQELFIAMSKCGVMFLADATEKIDRFSKYAGLIRDTGPHLWSLLVEGNKPSEVLNTIVQGDPWTTNMMFRYNNEGEVSEVKLLDFQATQYGSPIHDLVFFIWMSTNNDVKKYKLNEIYSVYRSSFNDKMEQFNCPERLTSEYFMDCVEKLNALAFNLVASFLPFVIDSDPVELGPLSVNGGPNESSMYNFYKKYYNEAYCNNRLPEFLECLEIAGAFEYLQKKLNRY